MNDLIIIRKFSVPIFSVDDFFPNGTVNTTALLIFVQNIRKEKCKTFAKKMCDYNENVLVTYENSYEFSNEKNEIERKEAAGTGTVDVEFKQFYRPSFRPTRPSWTIRRRTTTTRTTTTRKPTKRPFSFILRGRFRDAYLLVFNVFLRLIRMEAVIVESSPASATIMIVPYRK